ncbi:MAG: bifunctional DNA-formamidopyrimidine glycosylase/DNA-(apurinic or apyrimidinic site) lyase [Candidatus Bathyarchaeia archaeon]|jgi:formamidopyrimidine-DNA glycosylase|nr:bifunctional DNA-formamidopyrimidine glycosylase/DNA-(apurinic or apyrimidinic site) lyase [Candidatus Bathyarchaeota archaeon A05DMB-4]MDH7595904.1 bifunctional DNA-formamidopyrimidine glycosylase/DNA-(apurinic or apyrimidinic site) lyase [Candidatus Bathyarchaeota archaeon]
MPELPEITVLARQMNKELQDKQVAKIESKQPKNLNMPPEEFAKKIKGKTITNTQARGKWIFIKLQPDYYLLLNLGMNGDLLYFNPKQAPPQKYHFKLEFTDKTGFTLAFQWFGYIHLVAEKNLDKHKLTGRLGITPTDKQFTLETFKKLLANKKTGIKNFLLNQKNIAGIGNVYIQDTLFRARLHPNRKTNTLTPQETEALYNAIKDTVNQAIKLGGLAYEKNFYGKHGQFTADHFQVGYKTDKPCPDCGTKIQKIRTGTTASYICPKCQPETHT